MTLENETFQIFQTLLHNLLVYGSRPDVYRQIGLGIAVWVTAGVFVRLLRRWADPRISTNRKQLTGWRRFSAELILEIWRRGAVPITMLLAMLAIIQIQSSQSTLVGLLFEFASIIFIYIIFQLIIALLYSFGNHQSIRLFNRQFMLPLFVLVVTWRLLSRLVSTSTLLESDLVTLFGSPITVSAALIATIGLYLWIIGINALENAAVSLLSHRRDDVGSAKASLTLIRYLIIVIGFGIALSQLNFDATTIAAITGGLSVGIGFALSTILSNFISGVILLFERSIEPGDVIEIEEQLSVVEEVSMRAMRVRTLNNIEVVIPNQIFVSESFTTYTGSDKRIRVQLPVGTGYEDDPQKVIAALLELAQAHPYVLENPAPSVLLTTFGESSIDYLLNVWLSSPLYRPQTVSELNIAVYNAFIEHGFTIPFPQRDLHIIPPENSDGSPHNSPF